MAAAGKGGYGSGDREGWRNDMGKMFIYGTSAGDTYWIISIYNNHIRTEMISFEVKGSAKRLFHNLGQRGQTF